MYWFRRPPYWRWAAAAVLVLIGTISDLRTEPTVLHPFAAEEIRAGTLVTDSQLEWRQVPRGLLPTPVLDDVVARRDLVPGDPLVPGALASARAAVPAGWWVLPLTTPAGSAPGDEARVLVLPGDPLESPAAVRALVVETARPASGFELTESSGTLAVPGEAAPLVAGAAAEGRVTVALVPGP